MGGIQGSRCSTVLAEIKARVAGTNGWIDPHNGGTYQITSESDSRVELTRTTGDKKYTDKMILTLEDDGSGCSLSGCSESQVTSVADFSTNFCNMHDLYCGTVDGCPVALTDLQYTETSSHSLGASTDKKACIVSSLSKSFIEMQIPPANEMVTLYKLSDGECGQATIDKKYEEEAEKFAGLIEGTCPSVGYTIEDGTTTITVPFLGKITVAKYKKALLTEEENSS